MMKWLKWHLDFWLISWLAHAIIFVATFIQVSLFFPEVWEKPFSLFWLFAHYLANISCICVVSVVLLKIFDKIRGPEDY